MFPYSRTYGTRMNKKHFKHSPINPHESFYTSIVTNQLPDGLGRVQTGDTVSKDNVVLLRVVGEGIFLNVSWNKVLLSNAAHRADL